MIRRFFVLQSMAVVCGVCISACAIPPVFAQTDGQSSDSGPSAASIFKFGELARDAGRLEDATKLFGVAMNQSSRDNDQLKQTLQIALEYAESLEAIGANAEAVCIYNWIGKAVPELKLPFVRAVLFSKLDWDSAMFSELRVSHRTDPEDLITVNGLASALLLNSQPELRNTEEALEVALSARDQIENSPRIARTIAMAAAATKDFDLAVEMQTAYIQSGTVSEENVLSEFNRLRQYSEKEEIHPEEVPAFALEDQLDDDALAEIARRSMVGVRVQGIVEGKNLQTGEVRVLASTRWTVGTVLDSFGTILLSWESVRVPTYDELLETGKDDTNQSSSSRFGAATREDVVGSTRWLEVPEIEIYSMPSSEMQSKSMGLAGILGTDEASGLALVELTRSSAFGFVRHAELKPARFAPEYRSLDPDTDRQTPGFELDYVPTDYITVPNLVSLESCESEVLAYYEPRGGTANLARFIALSESRSLPGAALFNQLGEIIGIRHQVNAPATDGQVAIPAAVCTRIAAKLATYGEVNRAYLPFTVASRTTGVQEPGKGMKVSSVTSDADIYQPMLNKFIVSLDGVPTPTLTEWLNASERVHDRGLETAIVEVYDPDSNRITLMTIPTVKPEQK